MEFHSYKEMLKEAMEKVPENIKSGKRFEMPQVVTMEEGNKTIVKNFKDILGALRRDEDHLSKYFFKQLATPGAVKGSTIVLQRRVSQRLLQSKLEDYVKEYVYCKACGNPDTKIIKEDRVDFMVCEACGAKSPLKFV
jgi:translation initiation factor 2 subunit 2